MPRTWNLAALGLAVALPLVVYFTNLAPPWFPQAALFAALITPAVFGSTLRAKARPGVHWWTTPGKLVIATTACFLVYALLLDSTTTVHEGTRYQVGFGTLDWSLREGAIEAKNDSHQAAEEADQPWQAWTMYDAFTNYAEGDEAKIKSTWQPWSVTLAGVATTLVMLLGFAGGGAAAATLVPVERKRGGIVVCYAREDNQDLDGKERWLDRVREQLEPFDLGDDVFVWSDSDIAATTEWDQEIQSALERARVAVLLVSNAFLGSDYIRRREMPLLLQRWKHGKVALLPLILEPCAFERAAYRFPDAEAGPDDFELGQIQTANAQGPLSELSSADRQTALQGLASNVFSIFAG